MPARPGDREAIWEDDLVLPETLMNRPECAASSAIGGPAWYVQPTIEAFDEDALRGLVQCMTRAGFHRLRPLSSGPL